MSLESKDYVVQEHKAVRAKTHHDLRLEHGGVLKSWAVPKGVPDSIGGKVLAIEVEDHTKHWLKFAGKIPKDQYGYGEVKILSRGKYVPLSWEKDNIKFDIISGEMKGNYVLHRLKENKWLLFRVHETKR